jgi:hypothetical protein
MSKLATSLDGLGEMASLGPVEPRRGKTAVSPFTFSSRANEGV